MQSTVELLGSASLARKLLGNCSGLAIEALRLNGAIEKSSKPVRHCLIGSSDVKMLDHRMIHPLQGLPSNRNSAVEKSNLYITVLR